MKCLVIAGHGEGDPGATAQHGSSYYNEAILTRKVAKEICNLTKWNVFTVDINAFEHTDKLVSFLTKDINLVLEIHFNSFKDPTANGTEIYITKQNRYNYDPAQILSNISNLGFKPRGIKRQNFKVIYKCEQWGVPAILIECCFISSPGDMAKFNVEEMAKAIVWGVNGKLYPEPKTEAKPSEWAKETIQKFEKLGIINSKRYQEPATREEVCCMIALALEAFNNADI